MDYYVGVDIGGTNVRIVICNQSEILLKKVAPTVKQGPPEAIGQQIIQLIETGLQDRHIPREDLKGIGTSSAGPFVDGISLNSPNICGTDHNNEWTTIPYLTLLRHHFGPSIPILLENDCVSSVQAEHLFGAGRGHAHCVYITLSTGVGGGILTANQVIEGKGKNAGHFGHMILQKDGPQCGCGQRGCAESLLSGPGIARRAQEEGMRYKGSDDFSAKEVFEAYYAGNPIARHVIEETIEYMGVFLCSIINITDTEVIILGGSVFLHNKELLLPAIREYISLHGYHVISRGVKIVPAQLGAVVGDLAGLAMVLPKAWISAWNETQPWKRIQKKLL